LALRAGRKRLKYYIIDFIILVITTTLYSCTNSKEIDNGRNVLITSGRPIVTKSIDDGDQIGFTVKGFWRSDNNILAFEDFGNF